MKKSDIIEKVDNISKVIIKSSVQCQVEIEKYIKAKQQLLEIQYTDVEKLNKAKEEVKQKAEKEIIKLIGNVFCSKDESGEYKATTSIYMASKPKIRWDAGKKAYYLEEKALWICNKMIENRD